MGVVLRARSADGRAVAIKVLRDPRDAEAIASFGREQRLSRGLGLEDGFVPVLDVGSDGGRPFLVMPILTGGTLRERLRRGRLSPEEAVALVSRIAEAVGRAHGRGIVHRDLKPANIIFTGDGLPLVADLGLAKHFRRDVPGASQSVSLSASGMTVGSPGYLAPEQLHATKGITPAADVFALSVVLYECITGKMPFGAPSLLEYEDALRANPRPLRELAPLAPRWLEAVCTRGLARDPTKRFADGRALASALRARSGPRSRIWAGLVATALLVLVGGAVLWRGRRSDAPVPPTPAPKPTTAPVASSAPSADPLREARACAEARDWDGALAALDRAIEAHPTDAAAWVERARVRAHQGDVAGARSDAARAVEVAPRSAMVWSQRGLTRALAGDFAGAIEDHSKAIELDPLYALAYTQRGLARTRCGDFDGALVDCRRALELDGNQAGAWAGIGFAQLQANDLHSALESLTRALAIDPSFVDALSIRAMLRARLGDNQGALADLDALVALDVAGDRILSARADVRMNLGDWKGAAADYELVTQLEPRSALAWNGLGWCRAHAGDAEGGVAACVRAVELAPDDGAVLHSLGWALAKKGEDARAIAVFDRAIERAPKLPDAFRDRGRARQRAGDVQGAIADYERALELAPDHEESPEIRRELAALRGKESERR
jgi:tetratricopeptide (TPR) repeat protein